MSSEASSDQESQGLLEQPQTWHPADGGPRAWLIVAVSLLVSGLRFGLFCSFSMVYVELLRIYQDAGMTNASYKTALVGSLPYGVMSLFSPVAGIMADRLGVQATTALGGWVAMLGMLLSSWLIPWVEAMYLTLGVMFGIGMSFLSTPIVALLGFYFDRRLGLANGIVFLGGSVFAVTFPPAVGMLIRVIGLPGVFRVIAGLMATIIPTAFILKVPAEARQRVNASNAHTFINKEICRNKKYFIWLMGFPIACFGYFVPFVHIIKFVEINYPERDENLFIICLTFATGIGRMTLCVLSDLRQVNVIVLQQMVFISSGVFILVLSITPRWELVLVIVICIGFCDGGYVAMMGKVAVTLCGVQGSTQAIGFLIGSCCIPLTFGPPLAGYIFDKTGSYFVPFLVAGCFPIIGGLVLTTMRWVPTRQGVES